MDTGGHQSEENIVNSRHMQKSCVWKQITKSRGVQ
jgi:hypothetical protein